VNNMQEIQIQKGMNFLCEYANKEKPKKKIKKGKSFDRKA
jgi:hypothetical protein